MDSNEFKTVVGKCYVTQFQEKDKVLSTEITKNEYEFIKAANLSVVRIQFYKEKMYETVLNHEDYSKKVNEHFELLLKPNKQDRRFDHKFATIDINRVLNNFVISFKSLLEHSEKKIIRDYGENSQEFKDFKQFSSYYYDKLFSYRLFIRLRDYTVHYSQAVKINLKGNKDKSIELIPHFNKSQLLRFKNIKQKLGKDLEFYNDDFPVKPLMTEIKEFLEIFYPSIIKILINKEKADITELLNFYNRYTKNERFGISISYGTLIVDQNLEMNFIDLEIEEAKIIKKIMDTII